MKRKPTLLLFLRRETSKTQRSVRRPLFIDLEGYRVDMDPNISVFKVRLWRTIKINCNWYGNFVISGGICVGGQKWTKSFITRNICPVRPDLTLRVRS